MFLQRLQTGIFQVMEADGIPKTCPRVQPLLIPPKFDGGKPGMQYITCKTNCALCNFNGRDLQILCSPQVIEVKNIKVQQ